MCEFLKSNTRFFDAGIHEISEKIDFVDRTTGPFPHIVESQPAWRVTLGNSRPDDGTNALISLTQYSFDPIGNRTAEESRWSFCKSH
jgi:hypothetical protein